jgi:hypothetical protein
MKTNIAIAGLLGIALGAGAMVALAHGVLDIDQPEQNEARPVEADGDAAPSDAEAREVSRAPSRPLRPGSAAIGHTPTRTPAQS